MTKQLDREEVLRRLESVHKGVYQYDTSSIRRTIDPVRVKCLHHGWFSQRLALHMAGSRCPKCVGKGVNWVDRFKSVHGDTYDYSQVEFSGYKTPVRIVCKVHGVFTQTPDNHFRGRQGCPACKGGKIRNSKRLPPAEFIRRAQQVHGGKYDYPDTSYGNVLTDKIAIVCPLHGEFRQTVVNHLAGKHGCIRCGNTYSRPEFGVFAHLAKFTPAVQRDRTILKPRELDIYAPDINLAVEYCGMYWHSHGDVEHERANRSNHHDKFINCRAKGIRLITLFETDWLNHQHAVRRLLRNAANKSKGKLMARKCELRKVPHREAVAFYDKYHVQGGAGNGEHYGLYWKSKLVACMRFTEGANDRGRAASTRTWTLTRYATRVNVAGGASRLFKAFVAEYDPPEVKSFSDNRLFGGGMYEQLGFTAEEHTAPDYMIWSPKIGLRPKSGYQRRNLADRQKEHGLEPDFDANTDPRSEREVTYAMGARRIYDCGKTRWLWTNPNKPLAPA